MIEEQLPETRDRRRRCRDTPRSARARRRPAPAARRAAEGVPLELVGQHLRLSGTVSLGYHSRLSDFVNNHEGLIKLRDVTVLRRNGDPTKVTSPSIWVNPDEVTLIGEMSDVPETGLDRGWSTARSRPPI